MFDAFGEKSDCLSVVRVVDDDRLLLASESEKAHCDGCFVVRDVIKFADDVGILIARASEDFAMLSILVFYTVQGWLKACVPPCKPQDCKGKRCPMIDMISSEW